jgi:hypothetical protein
VDVQLRVIGIKMDTETVPLEDPDDVSRIDDVQQRSQDTALWNPVSEIGWIRPRVASSDHLNTPVEE